ncbi:adenylate cyclase type 9 isoform X3 [Harmonia axyridis]|uniref:adenylate cyclase type 9 isoform X3 n=1 Tax=Harmonia axyridis TaxID=115357 RepID=UPI001E2779FD|nr:adenylate cyclase type 9 isoform X3 [Harmonia axyridis]
MRFDKRGSSVSFSKSDTQTIHEDHPSEVVDEDHQQLSLDPTLQTYLAEVSQRSGCWGRFFPIPFERASQKSWWDPSFDSDILEEQYKRSSYRHWIFKFRVSSWYILLTSSCWSIYFLVMGYQKESQNWISICCIFGFTAIMYAILIALLTYTKWHRRHLLKLSMAATFFMCAVSLLVVYLVPITVDETNSNLTSEISPVGHFSICIEILLLIYTLIPMKFYMCIIAGISYSVLFETLTLTFEETSFHIYILIVRFMSHFCIHLIGLHILIMTNVRFRNTFMKVGQSLLVRRQLESEKKLKENMIHSLMPPSVATWLLDDDENFTKNGMEQRNSDPATNDLGRIFRPFNMNRMEKVSILFADIVGFTKMSSNKSAEELVEILNNLFQRFDHLCEYHNCEKISTLGDCYYCVSGCPEPRPDHAKCCVEMGLSMIQAIKQFDEEKNEGVNMRVGIHTGTVLCGIVGTKRFKFDVWSNDVTLANRMESTGKPGMVHISETTLEYLDGAYLTEETESIHGLKTYFILGKMGDKTPSYSGSFRAEGRQRYCNSLRLFVSPPISSPTLSPQSRPRVLSCDTTSNFLKQTSYNPNMLSPDVCKIKASSLPSILDSENEQETDMKEMAGEQIKTPTSTASEEKYTTPKGKSWRLSKLLRKSDQLRKDNQDLLDVNQADSTSSTATQSGYKQVPTIIETSNGTPVLNGRRKDSWLDVVFNASNPYLEDQKESIDVKSYISQSRSDMGQYELAPNELTNFVRGGSYRSQYSRSPRESLDLLQRAGSSRSRRGRSPNLDIVPTERLTSVANLDDHHYANSRKDSGIKSNSRRSSIQQDAISIFQIDVSCGDILQQRVSGYYTSSQSSISSPQNANVRMRTSPFFDKFGTCIQNLRKQSDRQLIKCVQENVKSRSSYFIKPPLSKLTLFFNDEQMEQDYRTNVHSLNDQNESIVTLANSRFNTYFDIFVSFVVLFVTAITLLILHGFTELWLIMFLIFIVIQLCGFIFCLTYVLNAMERVCSCLSRFYRWNLFGGVLVSLPVITVMINFCTKVILPLSSDYLYTFLLLVGLVHFCNFTQLNCWMKNILATICSGVFISLFLTESCPTPSLENILGLSTNPVAQHCHYLYKHEIVMDLFLILFLVWLLNREFEITYRLSFHTGYIANRDKIHVQSLKNQADYLIYNIVPEHVAEQLKKNAKYSENFNNVGIIFASIVNFNEMYDESYLGGKEFLRVLNELIGDFDELLDRPEFQSIEKIKTIGSTFMAASGLNSELRREQVDPNDHLFALMDFALELQKVVEDFNRDLLEFNLIIRIGYNFGDVTAAVIGNTKLYYDIWGDAVNIASRMDTTGVNGHIQIGENCLSVLQQRYAFKPRGSIFVKGKDNMNVYLLEHKKSHAEIYQ